MSVGFFFLARSPRVDQLRILTEYLRYASDEFVYILDNRTDQETIDLIATWPGATVIPIEWRNDFSWARQQAVDVIQSDWICYFDPDEFPSHKLMAFIKDITTSKSEKPLGWLFWFDSYWGAANRSKGIESDWHLRLFRRDAEPRFYKPVHEQISLKGRKEDQTRHIDAFVRKAPTDCMVIHVKPQDRIDRDTEMYDKIERGRV